MYLSEKLAEFIANLDYETIPSEVKQRAKELMLDALGTALAAKNEACVLNAIKAFEALSVNPSEKFWSGNKKLDVIYAAMVNAIAAHALDFDDTHTEAILHASAILTPLCLTYGFSVSKDGKKVLKAFIVGWEIAARVGIASKGSFHKRGFHTTAIAGIFGSVAANCVLLDLNREQIINALGLAGSFASGVNEFLSNGSNSKVLHIANALKNGILVANFAKANMSGPLSIFEGRDNIFRTFGLEDECDKNELCKGLNEIWQVMQVSLKPYPSCHFAHGLIDCAMSLRNDGLKAQDIKSIHCFVDEVPISFICDPIEAKYTPQSAYAAKFSMPFLMALAFFDGKITLKSYEDLNRAELIEFAKKISYEKRKSSGFPKYFPGHLEAVLNDGRIIKKDVLINKGNFDNPLSFDELKDKFLSNASIALSLEKADELVKKLQNLENLNDFDF
ncbi:MmgE/PrpD family protein [Campylobacter lari]|uniref:MmgE/PrpD family protein n=1 Tax=Campylobacter lari TaxID=201 RepID=UPI00127215C8|nr:MmgE/PrpD family protein [Campylobacter lari]EAI5529298.1 MmgE/PrpD family protein [Campylobacter lari]EAJ0339928.1 MmgE/PrpD family protein [Campylobacter lari]EAK9938161.1 MmgE/PrpD family protein [Campylobacter lari]MCH3697977.1 MmgE/PrpD family protein [Campylobacter lari]MCV3487225.1 MmgE/PrpD family protein [Campylobacter lari]